MWSVPADPSRGRYGQWGMDLPVYHTLVQSHRVLVAWGKGELHKPEFFTRSRSRCERSGSQPWLQLEPLGKAGSPPTLRPTSPAHLESDWVLTLWWASGSPGEPLKHTRSPGASKDRPWPVHFYQLSLG